MRCEIEITNVRIAVIVPAMTSAHSANNPAIEPLTATQGRILALAWPIMLSNITVPLLGLVDTAILGHLEDVTYLGAVAIGSQLFTFMLWSFGFLRMGTTALTAQAYGRDTRNQAVNGIFSVLKNALWLAFPLALLITVIAQFMIPWLLPLFGDAQQSYNSPLQTHAQQYIEIRLLSVPAVLLQYTLVGWFIGLGKTRIPLLMLTSANVVNALLDYLFVYHLNMTSDGVAWGSVIGDYSASIIGAICVWRYYQNSNKNNSPSLSSPVFWLKLPQWQVIAPFIHINHQLFIRTLCLLSVFAFFTAQGARQGEEILAVNAVFITLLLLISNALDGFAHATESLVGQALGRARADLVKRILWLSGTNMMTMAALLSIGFFSFGPTLLTALTNNPDLVPRLEAYQDFLFLLPLVGVASYWLDGIFIGAAQTALMRNAMLAAALLVFLPLWWLLLPLSNYGLWLAFYGFLAARALFMLHGFLTLWRHPKKFM